MKKLLLVPAVISLLSGCLIMPPIPTIDLDTNEEPEVLAKRIMNNAKQCWTFVYIKGADTIHMERTDYDGRIKLEASRVPVEGAKHDPFLVVNITSTKRGSMVEVREGDFNLGTELNLSDDINRWLSGDLRCEYHNN